MISTVQMLVGETAIGSGPWIGVGKISAKAAFQVAGQTSSGTGSVTVRIEGSNFANPVAGEEVQVTEITLALSTTRASAGAVVDLPWRNVRARVTAISGTGASADVMMSA